MKSKIVLVAFFIIGICEYAEPAKIAILPVECLGYKDNWGYAIESAFANELINSGYEVLNVSDLNKILEMQQLTLSGIINNSEYRLELGKIIQAELVLAITSSWTGEYHLLDVRISEIQSGKAIFQRVYTTSDTTQKIIESGIKTIVDNIMSKESRSAVWQVNKEYSRTGITENIIQFARNLGASSILLCYAGWETSDSVFTYIEIENCVKAIFEELIDTSECAVLCCLDESYYDAYSKKFNSRGYRILNNYNTPADYLKENRNAIAVFWGNTTRVSLVMQNMDIEMRKRFKWIKRNEKT